MEIFFIGTGGGRVNLIRQWRGTGGFLIKGSLNFHVDPGPGALSNMVRLKQDPMKTDVLIVTHYHVDHCSDAGVLCEAMTGYGFKKQGILIGSKNAILGDEKGDRAISFYHQNLPAKTIVAEHGKKIEETCNGTKFSLQVIGLRHDEKTNFGFKLSLDGKIIGYISDTEYFPELGNLFSGCDTLIINNLKPEIDEIPDHLCTGDTIKILKIAKPKLCLLSHIGMKFFKTPIEIDAQRITEETGVKTIAGKDGMGIEIEEKSKKEKKAKLSDF